MQLWHPLATALEVNPNKNTSANTNGFEPITPKKSTMASSGSHLSSTLHQEDYKLQQQRV